MMAAGGSSQEEVLSDIFIPRNLSKLRSALDEQTREEMIRNMKAYQGEPVAPDEEFARQWIVLESDLLGLINAGLVPSDSVQSSGLYNESFSDFKMCADTLQSLLFEGDVFRALGNLRGFRRLFSYSSDLVLKHAFRGKPVEVLNNIYFGGNGVLPEDRMCLADPYHYHIIGKEDADED